MSWNVIPETSNNFIVNFMQNVSLGTFPLLLAKLYRATPRPNFLHISCNIVTQVFSLWVLDEVPSAISISFASWPSDRSVFSIYTRTCYFECASFMFWSRCDNSRVAGQLWSSVRQYRLVKDLNVRLNWNHWIQK